MASSSPEIARKVVSCFAVIVGIVSGMVMLTALGLSEVYTHVAFLVAATLIVGLAPILASFFATRKPRRAAPIFLSLFPLALLLLPRVLPLAFLLLPRSKLALRVASSVAILLGATVIPGLFWLFVSRRNWPLLFDTPILPRRLPLKILVVFGLVFALLASSVFLSLFLPWWDPIGDCSGRPLLNERGTPRNIDFTAQVLFVGPRSFHGSSLWSIARVEQRFSAPWSIGGLVILRGGFRPTDRFEHFFVEGQRSLGVFARFLPIIERVDCGRTQPLSHAIVALRILHDGAPRAGVRIIGRVYTSWQAHPEPVPGIEVLITGPAGDTVTATDADGIYDVTRLPRGQYTVELSTTKVHSRYAFDLESVAVDGCDLFLD